MLSTQELCAGTSLVVRWLRLSAANAGSMGSIPGWRTKIPHAVWHDQKTFLKKCLRRQQNLLAQLCLTLCNPMGLYSLWNSPGQNTGVGPLLQQIIPAQELKQVLLHCRWVLYQLSH